MSDTNTSESAVSLDRVRAAIAGADRATKLVVAVAVVALAMRLFALGYRVMHFDEARVAFWTLEWTRSGTWHYRYIIHGPFVQWVNHWLFAFFGTSDFVARLPVALVGTLLPLSVLLYREHFTDGELVGMAVLLSANPILLYYSRFMRSDLLVATFMFVALGFLVRLWDRRHPQYLYLALAFVALGFASKENAVVYPVCWAGMLLAVGGMELLYPRRFETRTAFVGAARERVASWGEWLLSPASRPWVGHLVGALVLFGALTVFFYAPRGYAYSPTRPHWVADPNAGLWAAGGDPIRATIGGIQQGFEHWGSSGEYVEFCSGGDSWLNENFEEGTFAFEYLCHMGRQLVVLKKAALPLAVFSVVGFAVEWTSDRPRVLVPAAFAWGVASVVGYPAGTDIFYPAWIATHAVVPLSIPGAVGLALLVRWGQDALDDEEFVDAAIAVGIVVMLVTTMVGVGVHHAYLAPQNGEANDVNMVQYAQPEGHMQEELRTLQRISRSNDGVDVIVYGSDFVNPASQRFVPSCMQWLSPWAAVSWAIYSADAEVRCVESPSELQQALAETNAPVVLSSEAQAPGARAQLGDGFTNSTAYQAYLSESARNKVVFYFNTSQVDYDPS